MENKTISKFGDINDIMQKSETGLVKNLSNPLHLNGTWVNNKYFTTINHINVLTNQSEIILLKSHEISACCATYNYLFEHLLNQIYRGINEILFILWVNKLI